MTIFDFTEPTVNGGEEAGKSLSLLHSGVNTRVAENRGYEITDRAFARFP